MRCCRKVFIFALMLFLYGGVASVAFAGQWVSEVERDDFGDQHVGLAMALSKGRGLVLRCEAGKTPMLMFATREQWADSLAVMDFKLLVKVDNGDVEQRVAVPDAYNMQVGFSQGEGVRVKAIGNHLFPLLEKIANAKRRIAVAVELAGQRFENTRFSARGSKRAFKRIWQYCGSKLGDYKKPELK